MEIHESESKGIRASGYLNGKRFVIINGSYAVNDASLLQSFKDRPSRVKKRKELIAEGFLEESAGSYVFVEDVEFNSPSEAASIIWGSMLNGRLVFGLDESALPKNHTLYFEIDSIKALEGYRLDRILAYSKRDRELVKKRKAMDDYTCQVCGFFLKIENKAIIDCHHLHPIAIGERETKINDLVSLCPNCHRIAHMREPIYSVREIAEFV